VVVFLVLVLVLVLEETFELVLALALAETEVTAEFAPALAYSQLSSIYLEVEKGGRFTLDATPLAAFAAAEIAISPGVTGAGRLPVIAFQYPPTEET
jgi:hypothetical protein